MDNQDHVTRLQKEREQRQKLDNKKDALAKQVYDLVNKHRERLPDPSQLQNLRSLAAGTESLEELKIYIWYQITRSGRAPIPSGFGSELVGIIEGLRQEALARQEEALAIKQVRLLLGYLYRYARYARDNQPMSSGAPRQSSNRPGGNR
jgi:hypothetical protein